MTTIDWASILGSFVLICIGAALMEPVLLRIWHILLNILRDYF